MEPKSKKDIKSLYESATAKKTAKEVREHYKDSWDYVVSPQLSDWDEKEGLLIGHPNDSITQNLGSKVFDPRLSTIALERAARVNAQNPSGKALAMSKDDRGKNMLMNLMMDKWVLPNANSQYDYLIKNRLWDLYSMVYGVQFKLIDYVVKPNYQGPDSWLLPIRDCRPQPGKFSLNDSDWFGVSTWVTVDWLKQRDRNTWKNIDALLLRIKDGAGTAKGEDNSNRRSYIERYKQPATSKDKAFPQVEIYTEYRRGEWITIAPEYDDIECLRNIENPQGNYEIPVVGKYCFPLMDSIYGLGEFERGKTLQYAINSLINMYLTGVGFSIAPPMLVDANGIVASSIVYEPFAKWLITKPNAITPLPMSPQGIQSFQSTYSFLTAALMNQAGTTDTSVSKETDPTQGKTPQALQMVEARENARDSWDRFMMEKAIEEEMKKYTNLVASKMNEPVEMRLFAKEIEEIAQVYPDVVDMADGAERGMVVVSPEQFANTKFDYQIVSGSTYKADQAQELQNSMNLLNLALDPQRAGILAQALAEKGKKLDISELFQRTLIASGTQDWDKIIVDMTAEDQAAMFAQQAGGIMPPDQMAQQAMGQKQSMIPDPSAMPQGGQPQGQGSFADPEIQQIASQLMQGQV